MKREGWGGVFMGAGEEGKAAKKKRREAEIIVLGD